MSTKPGQLHSSFSLQTLDLLRTGATLRASMNITLSVLLCVGAVALGHIIAARLTDHAVPIVQAAIEEEG